MRLCCRVFVSMPPLISNDAFFLIFHSIREYLFVKLLFHNNEIWCQYLHRDSRRVPWVFFSKSTATQTTIHYKL